MLGEEVCLLCLLEDSQFLVSSLCLSLTCEAAQSFKLRCVKLCHARGLKQHDTLPSGKVLPIFGIVGEYLAVKR